MRKMGATNVLISGMKGLGVEIAKNVILAGVKSVTIHDPEEIKIEHLSSQVSRTCEGGSELFRGWGAQGFPTSEVDSPSLENDAKILRE